MVTETLKQEKAQELINWGYPSNDNDNDVTLSEYCTMIKQAEEGKGISFEQYTKKTQEWLQKNL